MASQNDNSGAAMGIAFVFAILGVMAIFVYALLAFVALVFTILCVIAWNNTLTIGKLSLHPQEARAFVLRGILGAGLVPAFAVFVAMMFEIQIDPDFWPHLFIGGYALGSVGVEMVKDHDDQTITTAEYHVQPPRTTLPPRDVPQLPPSEPFRFASWDDEEDDQR